MKKSKVRTVYTRCPRCQEDQITRMFALSRRDNETEVCSQCGTKEAMEDAGYFNYNGPIYWKEK